jgi:hypothetical protein
MCLLPSYLLRVVSAHVCRLLPSGLQPSLFPHSCISSAVTQYPLYTLLTSSIQLVSDPLLSFRPFIFIYNNLFGSLCSFILLTCPHHLNPFLSISSCIPFNLNNAQLHIFIMPFLWPFPSLDDTFSVSYMTDGAFWVVMLCSLIQVYPRLRGTCNFHRPDDGSSK